MPIKDGFSYASRWDSVGLDCQHCKYFYSPKEWPDENRVSFCKLHKVSLSIELNKEGYKEYEWFCKDFENTGKADENAVKYFESIKNSLQPRILYRLYGADGNLIEHDMKNF